MKNQLLTLNNNHVFVCGITRSGKTYFVKNALAQIKSPVLFFNVQGETMPTPFLAITPQDEAADILRSLRKGYKIDFDFGDLTMAQIMSCIAYLCNRLMTSGSFNERHPVYVVVDEAQILEGRALKAVEAISTRGLSRGVRLVAITQRPALCSKTIYTQAAEQYLFRLAPSEAQYLKNKGIDYERCRGLWEQLGDHSYIFYDGFVTEGRRAI